MTDKRPIYPIHPGTVLADELAEIGMTPAELARKLHVPSNRLYQLIAGKRAMTADTALPLEQWLGVEARFWMNLQKNYELDLTAEQIGAEIKRTITRRLSSASGPSTGLMLQQNGISLRKSLSRWAPRLFKTRSTGACLSKTCRSARQNCRPRLG